jgi:Apoptogenic protein 1
MQTDVFTVRGLFQETEWRLHRQRVDHFNEDFWSSNNALFVNAKVEYEESSM